MKVAISSSSASAGTAAAAAAPMNAPGIAPVMSRSASLQRIEPRRENAIVPAVPAKK